MNKLLFLVSLILVALALLDSKHGVHSQSILRSIVNPSEEKVAVGEPAVYYDDFYLAQQWPGTVCKLGKKRTCKKPIPNKFTIHGLWPQNTTAWPNDTCCGMPTPRPEKCYYNGGAISPTLRTELEMTWPNLFGDNDMFWDHEWYKHGACTVDEISQSDYFRKTNDLYKMHDFLQILQDADFKANGSTYNVADIQTAIWRVTGLSVIVKCQVGDGNISYLKEIYACVKKTATGYQCCKPPTTNKCKPRAVFPKI